MAKRMQIQLIVVIATLALIAVACGGSARTQQPAASPARQSVPEVTVGTNIGQRAPDFTLKDLKGNPISLSDYRGRPVLLNFMHTWCVPCNNSAPRMKDAFDANKDKGLG